MLADVEQIEKESYRLLVESVRDYAIFMIDVNGYVVSWNKGAEQIKGYNASEIIGRHFSVFYVSAEEAEINLQKARELGRYEVEGWRIRKDGSKFWANVVLTALKDNRGNIVGFGKVTRDMTRRRKFEDEIRKLNKELEVRLKESENTTLDYKHAIEESCIVAVTDQKGIINYVNDNFCKISKYSRDELIGQDHRIINSGYHSKELIRDLWVTIANGRIWRGELKNKAKDGTFYWVDTTIVPFLDKKGKPYQYIAIRADITSRKLAEEQIIKNNEALEIQVKERTAELTEALERERELNEMKSRFVSMASHEFRTPLSAILSSVGLVDHYNTPEHDEKRRKHIERIKLSVKNLTDILNDFLSLDKLEQGKVEAKNLYFKVDEFMEDIIEEMDGMLKKKRQKILYMNNGADEVYLDEKVLRNVLLNLLSNAVKYSPEEMEIHIRVAMNDEKLSISIRDQGIGIPAEAQKNLFTKFFRARNASDIQGTGLGLNIVKKYVELLKGDISFISKENEGSTFTVEFPQFSNYPATPS
jgi:PAS domain S-box-containing protein